MRLILRTTCLVDGGALALAAVAAVALLVRVLLVLLVLFRLP